MSRWPYSFSLDDVLIEHGHVEWDARSMTYAFKPHERGTGVRLFHLKTETEIHMDALSTVEANMDAALRRLERKLNAPL